jgi:hypothetical protein
MGSIPLRKGIAGHKSEPELTPVPESLAVQPRRFYTWQLGKGSSNYQKILERRREILRSKDLVDNEVLRQEWVDLISELDGVVTGPMKRIVVKDVRRKLTLLTFLWKPVWLMEYMGVYAC